ncbi:MAG: glycosyltransferase family 2 protein [Runella sp.]
MLPLVSIITITYNAEPYLERTLKSIQANLQEIADPSVVEYVIIDGQSKDNTLQIAAQYRPIVSQIISEPDKGLYDAMNKGLGLVKGKYVWFMNAGDEIHDKDVLNKLLVAMQSDADVYYSDALFVQNDGSPIGLRSQVTPHRLPKNLKWQDMAWGMKVCHQAFVARRSLAPLYKIENLSADIDWEIEVLKNASRIKYLDFILCKYLTGGISVQKHRKSLIDRFKVLQHHFGFWPTIFNHLVILGRSMLHKIVYKNG